MKKEEKVDGESKKEKIFCYDITGGKQIQKCIKFYVTDYLKTIITMKYARERGRKYWQCQKKIYRENKVKEKVCGDWFQFLLRIN